jgi:thymidylate synthase (FAD)
MNIIKPYAKILPTSTAYDSFTKQEGIELLKKIEWCARISHRSEDAVTENSYDRFLRSVVLSHGDWSVVEHASVSVDMYVDRGITHEIVRHRLFSFTQESTRFVNYEKKIPASFVCPIPEEEQTLTVVPPDCELTVYDEWRGAIHAAELGYRQLIRKGVSPQVARSVFPNALASRIIVTGNLRNWRHFLLMRTTKECHPQMRDVTIPLLEEFKEKIPIFYEDIEPLAKQATNIQKGR